MPCNIIQRFLDDAVDMNRRSTRERKRIPRLFIRYVNAGLPFHGREVPGESGFEASLVQHYWMQRLRQAANCIQSVLRDLSHFVKFCAQGRAFRSVLFRASQHGADSSENLSELVMQFARDVTQSGLLRCDELLRQIAALCRERSELREQSAVGSNQVQTGEHDGRQRRSEKYIHLSLHAIVNRGSTRSDLFLILVILHQQTRDCRAERCLASLQRDSNLGARLVLLAVLRKCESSIGGVPELSERRTQKLTLLGRALHQRYLLFAPQCVVQVGPDTLELRRPRRKRIRLVGIPPVPHPPRQ